MIYYVPCLFSVVAENGRPRSEPMSLDGQNPHPAFGEIPYLQLSDGSSGWLGFLIVSLA